MSQTYYQCSGHPGLRRKWYSQKFLPENLPSHKSVRGSIIPSQDLEMGLALPKCPLTFEFKHSAKSKTETPLCYSENWFTCLLQQHMVSLGSVADHYHPSPSVPHCWQSGVVVFFMFCFIEKPAYKNNGGRASSLILFCHNAYRHPCLPPAINKRLP